MHIARKQHRIAVDIAVNVITVLDSCEGTIVDLTEFGAQITGTSLPKGKQFQIDFEGHTVFATVMWSEVDRMGVRFPFELHEGPLFDALEAARHPRRLAAQRFATISEIGRAHV